MSPPSCVWQLNWRRVAAAAGSLHCLKKTDGCFWGNSLRPHFLVSSAFCPIQPRIRSPHSRKIRNSSLFLFSLLWDSWCGAGGQTRDQEGHSERALCCWKVSVRWERKNNLIVLRGTKKTKVIPVMISTSDPQNCCQKLVTSIFCHQFSKNKQHNV